MRRTATKPLRFPWRKEPGARRIVTINSPLWFKVCALNVGRDAVVKYHIQRLVLKVLGPIRRKLHVGFGAGTDPVAANLKIQYSAGSPLQRAMDKPRVVGLLKG